MELSRNSFQPYLWSYQGRVSTIYQCTVSNYLFGATYLGTVSNHLFEAIEEQFPTIFMELSRNSFLASLWSYLETVSNIFMKLSRNSFQHPYGLELSRNSFYPSLWSYQGTVSYHLYGAINALFPTIFMELSRNSFQPSLWSYLGTVSIHLYGPIKAQSPAIFRHSLQP